MTKQKRIMAFVLGLCLLAGCASRDSTSTEGSSAPVATPDSTPAPTEAASAVSTPDVTPALETTAVPEATSGVEPTPNHTGESIRVAMLKGPTGLGAAKLMDEAAKGETDETYTFTVLAEPTEAAARLTNGEVDIAAVATNLASSLYHKTDGGVQLLALNTRGVLYILENGETVSSLSDLAGKTVYATGQGANPEYVLNYLLKSNGLTPGEDVTIEWKASDELTALMATGDVGLCMLPVPAATSVLLQNSNVRKAVSLTEAWEESAATGTLTMGCVVVRTEFAQAHPEAVEEFLDDYEDSISFMADPEHLDEAALLAETYGIVPSQAVARAALPDANLTYEDGSDMVADIQGYYVVLFAADPASIGGSIPDGAFYYNANS